jgi:ectoine hydroxylase-related dioxygenase (phytanoyl-CoA dioxygenase family)
MPMAQVLTDDEAAKYRRDGYVTPAWRLPDELLAETRAAVDRLIADNPQVRPEQLVCPHIRQGTTGDLKGDTFDFFLKLAHQREVVAAVTQAIGPNAILWGSQLFSKRSGDGLAIPWHQDGHYWPMRPQATCSVWIAVDASTVENGCLRVIPGSHLTGLHDHVTGDGEGAALNAAIDAAAMDEAQAVDIELQAGQVSLHDAMLVHGSNPNRSAKRRAGLVFRYMPASSVYDRSYPDRVQPDGHVVRYSTRPLYLVAGNDPGANDVTGYAA